MNTTSIIEKDEILQKIIKIFDNEIYLVGGSVRDFFMGIETHDRDLIVTDCDAREFSVKVAELFDATFIPLDEENRIYRVVMPDKINYLDITNPIGGSLEKDLMRRDLTINAIAINIRTGEIIDLSGGITDIKNGCLNYILEENFKDDPLRILRVYRFQAIYGFEISSQTLEAIIKYSDLVLEPAVERINYELLKLFGGKYAHIALEDMDKTGILEKFFPFVSELKKVPPNSHHHLDLFHHSLETVRNIEEVIAAKQPGSHAARISGKWKVESGK
ncbi:CCA tRNA nucleotidyltransferase, partial [bacterium]|nr:CCA tRNA nucleotidyltransferase [bacterium]